ncbi:hypothetical protein RHGRI_003683 [Rhododendron griersonianum]|uniref:Uncharacterized protein n=1 Tax=Rhododendron griersonianum TaxID=479676 RepID=A0AAV6L6Q5_9ERIC|nr:hypothetical protein RHGRI_003683 [Rhododendron griersonianum]
MEEKEAIRAKVVTRKYGLSEVEWLPKLPNRGHVSNVWKDIHSVKYASDLARTFWKASRLRSLLFGLVAGLGLVWAFVSCLGSGFHFIYSVFALNMGSLTTTEFQAVWDFADDDPVGGGVAATFSMYLHHRS